VKSTFQLRLSGMMRFLVGDCRTADAIKPELGTPRCEKNITPIQKKCFFKPQKQSRQSGNTPMKMMLLFLKTILTVFHNMQDVTVKGTLYKAASRTRCSTVNRINTETHL